MRGLPKKIDGQKFLRTARYLRRFFKSDVSGPCGKVRCERAFPSERENSGVGSWIRRPVGALKAMGALEMGLAEEELQPLVNAWRQSNPNRVRFWWDVDSAVKRVIKKHSREKVKGIEIYYKSGMLFILLPSGRRLSSVKPRMEENRFGGESVTYERAGVAKKWERIESYSPKFVENIVRATARDLLMFAMRTLTPKLQNRSPCP